MSSRPRPRIPASCSGVNPAIYRRRMDFYLNDAEFDCSRANEVLDWQPAVDLEEGFGRTLASYREVGWVQ